MQDGSPFPGCQATSSSFLKVFFTSAPPFPFPLEKIFPPPGGSWIRTRPLFRGTPITPFFFFSCVTYGIPFSLLPRQLKPLESPPFFSLVLRCPFFGCVATFLPFFFVTCRGGLRLSRRVIPLREKERFAIRLRIDHPFFFLSLFFFVLPPFPPFSVKDSFLPFNREVPGL